MSTTMRLIWKLLRRHISLFELSVFFIANLIGMTIMLCGVQIYHDVRPMVTGESSLIGNEYMIVTRPVERVGGDAPSFSEEEIEELRSEEFVVNMGLFASSQYEVYGSIVFNGRTLSTMMFFESVPDEFVDVESSEWVFNPEEEFIPIIIPRNYLNLYNFGFSQTQSLPQITEEMIKRVELNIRLGGNGHTDNFTARIVGFSDRLNTILVPMSFMQWANNYYANCSGMENPTRLIIELHNPGAPEVTTYLEEHGYIAEDKPSESSKALWLLQLSITLIVGIGFIFSALSIIILTLSIYLLLQKNITKLENLMLIGYTPKQVSAPYNMLTIGLNVGIYVVSIVAVVVCQQIYMGEISALTGLSINTSPMVAILTGAIISVVVTLFNIVVIRRKVTRIARRR